MTPCQVRLMWRLKKKYLSISFQMTGHICIHFVNVHMNYHPEVKSDCIQPSNLSQPDKNWNWFFKLPWLPNWFRKKPMVYARSLMVTNYWNLKNEYRLGKLKCLPVHPFTGTLLAHLAGLAAEVYRHTHMPQMWRMQLASLNFRARSWSLWSKWGAQCQGQQAEQSLPS